MAKDRRRIRPASDGGFYLRLPAEERALLASVPSQLRNALASIAAGETEIPESMRRLFPPAYLTDDPAEARYVELTRSELLNGRREALDLLVRTAEAKYLVDAELEAWLATINDLRLVLGTTLEVTEEPSEVNPADPNYGEWVCYSYLSYLEGEIIDALTDVLPPASSDAEDELPDDPWGDPPGDLRWDGTPAPREP